MTTSILGPSSSSSSIGSAPLVMSTTSWLLLSSPLWSSLPGSVGISELSLSGYGSGMVGSIEESVELFKLEESLFWVVLSKG